MRPPITTHILDTHRGAPATGVGVGLSRRTTNGWRSLACGSTDGDGRIETWSEGFASELGVYQLEFATADYFRGLGVQTFYPSVTITFEITDRRQHYHVPLLLSAYGYSTYRGS
ncbi:hydroxyisourate hydrolase [Exilibacterium tricleocarpae]|uniref:5-hydroxyisourate hydrolase n=1 Tax=Exilibacterium tricleocarpae TaxID=2591008 RepID=A0A545U9Q2_9GAMM|nr:hydroxyisourate hydrolase [Exilibacterium tricleocarpae]TQV86205.1 hydroxyisourate hydrolase [Exilibacterium tricleocarpae]